MARKLRSGRKVVKRRKAKVAKRRKTKVAKRRNTLRRKTLRRKTLRRKTKVAKRRTRKNRSKYYGGRKYEINDYVEVTEGEDAGNWGKITEGPDKEKDYKVELLTDDGWMSGISVLVYEKYLELLSDAKVEAWMASKSASKSTSKSASKSAVEKWAKDSVIASKSKSRWGPLGEEGEVVLALDDIYQTDEKGNEQILEFMFPGKIVEIIELPEGTIIKTKEGFKKIDRTTEFFRVEMCHGEEGLFDISTEADELEVPREDEMEKIPALTQECKDLHHEGRFVRQGESSPEKYPNRFFYEGSIAR